MISSLFASIFAERQHSLCHKETTHPLPSSQSRDISSYDTKTTFRTDSRHGILAVPEGTISIPPSRVIRGKPVHVPWPSQQSRKHRNSSSLHSYFFTRGKKAHFRVGDNLEEQFFETRLHAGTYNLLQTDGMQINAQFSLADAQPTHINRIGILLGGLGGYSRIRIHRRNPEQLHAFLNGHRMHRGQSARLSDGGIIHLNRNAHSVFIRTHKRYQISSHIQKGGKNALTVALRVPSESLRRNGRPLRGLLPSAKSNAIDFIVPGGLFARPSVKQRQFPLFQVESSIGPAYHHYFGLDPLTKFNELSDDDLRPLWEQFNMTMLRTQMENQSLDRHREQTEKIRKLELLLVAALNSGHLDMAVMMLSAVETRMANDLTRALTTRIHLLQRQRQSLSSQMAALSEGQGKSAAQQLQSLVTQASGIGTEISLLQTFLQDAAASKRNSQEFASRWIRQSHETTRSIIQSIGR